MRRRDFISLLGGAAVAWPHAAIAQQPDRVRRIGLLMVFAATDPEGQRRAAIFAQALQKLGWTDGSNVRIDYRWAGGDADQTRTFAKELVSLAPDVLLAGATPPATALQSVTRTIPIVFVGVSDPVGQGIVESLAHPGGNLTGFTDFEFSLGAKWLETLKAIAPRVTRVALIFNPKTARFAPLYLRSAEAAASSFVLELTATPVHDDAEVERALTSLGSEPGGSVLVLPDIFTVTHRKPIIELAARYRLPAVYPYRYFAADGGLLSYGIDPIDPYLRAASYVDRILKGAKPADLPVQQPTKFELVINMKTAKALGLTVPPSLLVRADEVIE
jgi:putative ABC transport system substrate-binding protein